MFVQTEADRRAQKRQELSIELALCHDDKSYVTRTEDLSTGGLRLLVPVGCKLEVGDVVRCQLHLPRLVRELDVRAIVRWMARGSAGISFATGLRAEETWAIHQLVADHSRELSR